MENISLRAYIRKIENQIDNGQIDEAIAHSKHILQTYPKHIDSYRLLGKTLLEKQKYGDASDIFQRVLSSVPDDFISHIGMSMIREDENNLDAAIWHMERAFEVQPSNKAVQDELRRLYTNRDGIAPPKIRLTRGALVRMYTRGELYNQAIAEILAALTEDPNRVDLEVMLARIYFQLGKKVDATETCSKLISKLPYCLEANKILTEILLGTSREEDQKIFRQRVIDLDPYFQFVNEKTLTSADVSDSSIMLEFLDWDPATIIDDQPDWAQSIGFVLDDKGTSSEDFSSWIDEIDSQSTNVLDDENAPETAQLLPVEEQTEVLNLDDLQDANDEPAIPIDAIDENQGLPDWIKEAGWEVSKEEDESKDKGFTIPAALPIDKHLSNNKDDVEEEEEEKILPAEIPSWLKAIAPSGELINLSEDINDDDDDKNLENLFDSLEKDKVEFVNHDTKILWENEFSKEDEASLEETLRGFDFSSMLNDEDMSVTSSKSELGLNSPDSIEGDLDWMKSLAIEEEKVEDEDVTETKNAENAPELEKDEVINKQSLDQIISELEETEIEGENLEFSDDDWLNSFVFDEEKEGTEKEPLKDGVKDEIPDWIKSVVDEESEKTSLASSEETDSLPDWLSVSDDNIESKLNDTNINFEKEQDLPTPIDNTLKLVDDGENFEDKITDESYSELLDDETFSEPVSQLDHEFILESESSKLNVENSEENFHIDLETSSLEAREDEKLPKEDHLPSETEEDELDSALAWMEGLALKQGAEEETLISSPEERSETLPEWISEESKPLRKLSDETVSTPSWLKELEIETDEITAQDSEQLLEKLPPLDLDSSEEEKADEFSGEMETDRTETHEFKNLVDQLETEIDAKQLDSFDQEIDKEIHPLVDSVPETSEREPNLEEEVSENTFIEEVFKTEDQEFGLIEEIPSSSGEIIESAEENLESTDQELETVLREEEEVEDTQPIKIKDNRLAELEIANKYLDSGNPEESIKIFNSLIEESFELDGVITNIQNALDHHYPIDINLWQALGDAYFKNNQLQNALDAYSKAEDLLS